MVLGALPCGKILKVGKIVEALHGAMKAVRAFRKQQEWARVLMAKARDVLSRGCKNSFTP